MKHEKERWDGVDRRKEPTNPFSLASLRGRRRAIRPEDRNKHYYVDRYDPVSVLVFVLVVALSILDAFITLNLVNNGGRELNPVMEALLTLGTMPFLVGKYLLTGLGILFMIVHKEYYFFRGKISGRSLMFVILFLYILLILWEFYLLSHL